MREQIRLWFYSQLFMSVVLTGRAPFREVLSYEKMVDEHGREMHGSWGNLIEAEDAFSRMGADVMRWQYCAQPPSQNLWFGYGPGQQIKRKLLTLWNSVSFFVEYANIEGFRPEAGDLDHGPRATSLPLDRWLVARTAQLVAEASEGYDASLTVAVLTAYEAFVDDLSNWYIRRSRRRFWGGDRPALETLWYALVQSLRVIAPVLPFLAEHLWQNLVAGIADDAPDSVFLAGWPAPAPADAAILAEVAEVRRVIELGRQARAKANIRLRQPVARALVRGTTLAQGHADEIRDELRVKAVAFDEGPTQRVKLRPNLPVVGRRLGRKVAAVRDAMRAGDYEELPDGGIVVAGETLAPEEVLRGERIELEGWASAEDEAVSVAIDTTLTDELRAEARALDLIRELNGMRKAAGLELTDRVRVVLPPALADLLDHAPRIEEDVLAISIEVDDGVTDPVVEKA
jgi:isoleucyl-tRNA synthetase